MADESPLMDASPTVCETTWSGLPQYVCLRCATSYAGDTRALDLITSHMHSMHGEEVVLMSEPTPDEEPTAQPPAEPPPPGPLPPVEPEEPEDPDKEPAEVV